MAALRDRVASSAMRTRNLTKRRACSALKGRRTRPFSGCPSPVLERVQEHEQRVSRPDAQPGETVAGPLPLAIVRENRRIEARRAAVVQQPRPRADAPQWGGANLAAGGYALDDPGAEAAHVVEQEVRERLEHLTRQRRHRAVSRNQSRRVAVGAADKREDPTTLEPL